MQTDYDYVVVGVGAMGSATTYHLAERGHDVLGLERFDVPHEEGSSGGITRIIRLAYHEHPTYVPLLRRAYDLLDELEAETGRDLLYRTGSIAASDPEGPGEEFSGALQSCEEHDIDHEVLDPSEVNERFPGYEFPESFRAVYQPDGGFLDAPRCISAHVEAAFDHGATVRGRETVTDLEVRSDGVRVHTDRGRYDADEAVVTAGAWAADLLPELEGLAVPERQVLGWFQPEDPAAFGPEQFPVFMLTGEVGEYYGFPTYDVPGFKIGRHHHFEETISPSDPTPDEPTAEDERALRDAVERYFPGADGPTLSLKTCVYTNTPDRWFLMDRLPDAPVTVAGGFSGHGYKFASVVGEATADLATEGESDHDLSPFAIDRFD
jgi:sarcosine oxidase